MQAHLARIRIYGLMQDLSVQFAMSIMMEKL